MKKIVAVISILFLYLPLTSCSGKDVGIELSAPAYLMPELSAIVEENPLPEGFTIHKSAKSVLGGQLILEQNFPNMGKSGDGAKRNGAIGSTVIRRQYYTPVAKIWDPGFNLPLEDFNTRNTVLLEDVRLPDRAVSVEGMYPDNPDYPGLQTTTLKLFLSDTLKDNSEMKEWFNTLVNTYKDLLTDPPVITWIGAVGDIMVQRGVQEILTGTGSGMETIFGDTLGILQRQDLLLGNLEGTITERALKTPKSYNFKFHASVIPILHQAGFDYFCMTNNHIYDYGEAGFIDTLKNIKTSSISTSGIGMNLFEAKKYWETVIKGNKIRILSIGAYPKEHNGFDGKKQAAAGTDRPGILFAGPDADQAVKSMVGPDSFGILFIHGGVEWNYEPTKEQRDLYRKYIDMGADLILSSHPHVLQGVEAYNTKLIAYSMGNFIFPGMGGMPHAEESVILTFGITGGRIVYFIPYPVKINGRYLSVDHRKNTYNRLLTLVKRVNLQ